MEQLVLAGRVIFYLLGKEIFILSVLEMCPNYMDALIQTFRKKRQKICMVWEAEILASL